MRAHPNNIRATLSERLVRKLYIDQRLPISEVARRLGVAPSTLSRRLRDLAMPARPRGPVSRPVITD
jgi:transposase-like protein